MVWFPCPLAGASSFRSGLLFRLEAWSLSEQPFSKKAQSPSVEMDILEHNPIVDPVFLQNEADLPIVQSLESKDHDHPSSGSASPTPGARFRRLCEGANQAMVTTAALGPVIFLVFWSWEGQKVQLLSLVKCSLYALSCCQHHAGLENIPQINFVLALAHLVYDVAL